MLSPSAWKLDKQIYIPALSISRLVYQKLLELHVVADSDDLKAIYVPPTSSSNVMLAYRPEVRITVDANFQFHQMACCC